MQSTAIFNHANAIDFASWWTRGTYVKNKRSGSVRISKATTHPWTGRTRMRKDLPKGTGGCVCMLYILYSIVSPEYNPKKGKHLYHKKRKCQPLYQCASLTGSGPIVRLRRQLIRKRGESHPLHSLAAGSGMCCGFLLDLYIPMKRSR